jgi:hypothetical protein
MGMVAMVFGPELRTWLATCFFRREGRRYY